MIASIINKFDDTKPNLYFKTLIINVLISSYLAKISKH